VIVAEETTDSVQLYVTEFKSRKLEK